MGRVGRVLFYWTWHEPVCDLLRKILSPFFNSQFITPQIDDALPREMKYYFAKTWSESQREKVCFNDGAVGTFFHSSFFYYSFFYFFSFLFFLFFLLFFFSFSFFHFAFFLF
ncbi:hypothetical protein V8G54_012440, partial [Vigna mungo]